MTMVSATMGVALVSATMGARVRVVVPIVGLPVVRVMGVAGAMVLMIRCGS